MDMILKMWLCVFGLCGSPEITKATDTKVPDHPAGYRLYNCHPVQGCVEPDQRLEFAALHYCKMVAALATAKYKASLKYYPNDLPDIEAKCFERDPRWPPISPERRSATAE